MKNPLIVKGNCKFYKRYTPTLQEKLKDAIMVEFFKMDSDYRFLYPTENSMKLYAPYSWLYRKLSLGYIILNLSFSGDSKGKLVIDYRFHISYLYIIFFGVFIGVLFSMLPFELQPYLFFLIFFGGGGMIIATVIPDIGVRHILKRAVKRLDQEM